MGGPEFFETQMGRRFFEGTMPQIARALTTIAKTVEAPAKTSAERAAPELVAACVLAAATIEGLLLQTHDAIASLDTEMGVHRDAAVIAAERAAVLEHPTLQALRAVLAKAAEAPDATVGSR